MQARMRLGLVAVLVVVAMGAGQGNAASREQIDAKVDLALKQLLAESPAAQALSEKAVAVLVYPDIVKAGFGVGGQYGEGALRRRDGVTGGFAASSGYYNITSASFGFQISAQSFGEALFFMTEDALGYLGRSKGFEVGVDANVAVVDKGVAVDATSSTIQDPIVAFVFGQQGLMAGATVQGSKISRIHPK